MNFDPKTLQTARYRLFEEFINTYGEWKLTRAPNPDLSLKRVNDFMNEVILTDLSKHCFDCELIHKPMQHKITTTEWELEYPLDGNNTYMDEYMTSAFRIASTANAVANESAVIFVKKFNERREQVAAQIIENLKKEGILSS